MMEMQTALAAQLHRVARLDVALVPVGIDDDRRP